MPRRNSATRNSNDTISAVRLQDMNEDIDDIYTYGNDRGRIVQSLAGALKIDIGAFVYTIGSNIGSYAGGTGINVTNSATNYVMVNTSGTIVINTTGRDTAFGRLGIVVCAGGVITSITIWKSDVVGGNIGAGSTTIDADLVIGEDFTLNETGVIEPQPLFSEIQTNPQSPVTDNNTGAPASTSAKTAVTGLRITTSATKNIVLRTVTKNGSCNATRCGLFDDAGVQIGSYVSFVANVATFADVQLNANTNYRIGVDNSGASYNSTFGTGGYPVTRTNVTMVNGINNGIGSNDTSNSRSIDSVTTVEIQYNGLAVGDDNARKRQTFRAFGSGVSGSTFKIGALKVGSPAGNMNVRIETDSSGSPSGTLFDANATGTVTAASLSAFLPTDITITLAGSIIIPVGQLVHLVFYMGSIGSETVSASHYYKIGYTAKHSTVRYEKAWNGTVRSSTTNKQPYSSGSIFASEIMQKSDADYTYKIFPAFVAKATKTVGNACGFQLTGYSTLFSGTKDSTLYISNTPGATSTTPGTNKAILGRFDSAGYFKIEQRNLLVATQTIPASGTSLQNTTGVDVLAVVTGGTVSLVKVSRDNSTLYTVYTATNCCVPLAPGDYIQVTYSVVPTSITFLYA